MDDTRTHTGSSAAGLVLGSYRILHELTSGGMGTVFRAQHVLLGRPAAVKLLRRDLTTSPELVQRFVNEARAVTACKHPGIVEVYDFGYTGDGHAFIVMELLEGESLGRRLARLRFTEIEAAAIGAGIASALKAAHRVGVIHRDLKPDNVFLVPDPDGGLDRTKVLDFGIAKLADGAPSTSQNTQTGALIGTPLYMAPEQARAAAAIDHRADLYSLGCLLYHMLTGRPPFVAEGAGEIIALQMFEDVVPPSRLAPVSPEMERVVLRLLEKNPADRFGNAGEVVAALGELDRRPPSRMTHRAGALGAEASVQSDRATRLDDVAPRLEDAAPVHDTAPVVAPRRRSAFPWIAGTLGVVALAVGGVGYATIERGRGTGPGPAAALSGTAPATPRPANATTPPAAVTAPAPGPAATPALPALGPATATAPTVPPAIAPALPPDPYTAHIAPPRRPARPRGKPSVGTITAPVDVRLHDPALERHRVDPPRPPARDPDHTAGGAPMENNVDLDPRPARRGTPPSAPKDPGSP